MQAMRLTFWPRLHDGTMAQAELGLVINGPVRAEEQLIKRLAHDGKSSMSDICTDAGLRADSRP